MTTRRRERRIESIKLGDLRANKDLAVRAARQRGGVRVVDELGRPIFRLTIPSVPLTD